MFEDVLPSVVTEVFVVAEILYLCDLCVCSLGGIHNRLDHLRWMTVWESHLFTFGIVFSAMDMSVLSYSLVI